MHAVDPKQAVHSMHAVDPKHAVLSMRAVDPKHAVHSMRAVDPNPFKATTFPRFNARRGSQARRAFKPRRTSL
jgi:hypothetical protein